MAILNQLGLEGIALHEQPTTAITILEKLETYSNVGYAIVILSRDETLPDRILAKARQNVVFEFGYFVGLLGRDRVACLIQEGIELPSDTTGIVYIRFHDSINEPRVRGLIGEALRMAGYRVMG